MLSIIGLCMVLSGAAIYVAGGKHLFDEIRLLLAGLLFLGGVVAVVAATPAPEEREAASVAEARAACQQLARQSEAEAWLEGQAR